MYGASPFPRSTLGYASSTANDISADAFRHLEDTLSAWPPDFLLDPASYSHLLENMRRRIRSVWGLTPETDMVFAPSGTDLEFVALALAQARAGGAVASILLGADEIGSGCAHSAAGRFFANETAVRPHVPLGEIVPGFGDTECHHIAIRDLHSVPLTSVAVAERIEAVLGRHRVQGRSCLVHVVYGSKTGLILPEMPDLAALIAAAGPDTTFVVDACQARLDGAAVRHLLALGCIVMVTGSKFMGGPPFSGFALVPPQFRPDAPLPGGLAAIFRRGEWPAGWAGCDHLPVDANPGLLLRLEAALFELERFASVDGVGRGRVIAAFGEAIRAAVERLGVRLVTPCLDDTSLHRGTMATLDLSCLPSGPDFAVSRRWHRVLAARGLRVGQPVKCARRADGEWAGTLRLSLSMPLIVELAGLPPTDLASRLVQDMARITDVLEAAQRPLAA